MNIEPVVSYMCYDDFVTLLDHCRPLFTTEILVHFRTFLALQFIL